jgi:hypothetical protein
MAFDAVHGSLLLFGGRDGPTNSSIKLDTWQWDGANWTQLADGPYLQDASAMAFDSGRGVIVLFGNIGGSGGTGKFWEWDGAAWIQRVFTGAIGGFQDVGMAYDVVRGVCCVFGAPYTNTYNAQMLLWNGTAYSLPAPAVPTARPYAASAFDSARGQTVLFGGENGSVGYGDTWEFDGTTWSQRVVTGPTPRLQHAMAYDSARHVTVLFGGTTGSSVSNQTWEWNGLAWSLRAAAGPSARGAQSMAYDAGRAVTVLFGGSDGAGALGDTWEWDGTVWTQRASTGPSPRASAGMAYDSARGVTVLFGGLSGGQPNGETWEWDGAAWHQRVVVGPSARYRHSMAYDSVRQVTLLFGGISPAYDGDTWEWNGTAWTQQIVAGPTHRYGTTLAYDSARGCAVLFGGYDGFGTKNDTWKYVGQCSAPAISLQPMSISHCPYTPAIMTISTGDPSTAFTWQWRPIGSVTWINVVEGVNFDPTTHLPLFVASGGGTASVMLTGLVSGGAASSGGVREVRAIASDGCDSAVSDAATWSVCPADYNCSGGIDVQDIFDMLNGWFAGDSRADFNGVEGVNSQDIFDFLTAWFSGC